MPRTVLYTICFSEIYGTQKNVISTSTRLDRDRFMPLVAAPPGNAFHDQVQAEGVRTFEAPFRNVRDVSTVFELARIIRKEKVSLVHAHLGISSVLSLAASALAGGVPVVATRHFIEDRYTSISNPVLRSAYKTAYKAINHRLAGLVFVSNAVRDEVLKREGTPAGKSESIPNAIDFLSWASVERDTESARRTRAFHGVPRGAFLVTTLSRLVPEKGLEVLLEAAQIAEKQQPGKFVFVVAGDGPLRSRLEADAAKRGVSHVVRFAGYVQDVRALLAASDVFVLCAHAEPFGICVLESMAAGLPTIAAASGGPAEIITNSVDGLLFKPGSAASLFECIQAVTGDKAFSERIAAAGRTCAADFDETVIVPRIMDFYDSVLE